MILYLLAITTLITVASMGAIRFVRADRYAPASRSPAMAVPLPGSTEPISIVDPATMPSVLVEMPDAGVIPRHEKPSSAVRRIRKVAPATSATGDTPPPNPYPQ